MTERAKDKRPTLNRNDMAFLQCSDLLHPGLFHTHSKVRLSVIYLDNERKVVYRQSVEMWFLLIIRYYLVILPPNNCNVCVASHNPTAK